MATWFKTNFPGVWKFLTSFFSAMTNNKEGHSLRKWLAVGFFWLVAICVFRYTDNTNVGTVLTILCGMITTLVVTYSVANVQERKLELKTPPKDDNPPI